MSNVVSCQCGQSLVIQPQSAGQWIRCPRCNQSIIAPHQAPQAAAVGHAWSPTPAAPSIAQWFLRTADGQSFGPIPKSELDGWVGEGLVTGDALVLLQGDAQWRYARDVYPVLQAGGNLAQANNNVVVYVDNSGRSDERRTTTKRKQPHRGGLILALALIGWFVFPILCIFAWVMGAGDLKQMRAGRMDRSGEGMTQFGMIVGAVGTILMIIGLMMFFIVFMAIIAQA